MIHQHSVLVFCHEGRGWLDLGGRRPVRAGSLLQIPGWMAHQVDLKKACVSMASFDARTYPPELLRSLESQRVRPLVLQRPDWGRWFENRRDRPEELLARLSREMPVDEVPPVVGRAVSLAHEAVPRGWGAGHIAESLGYSLPHLTTLVARHTGRSLGRWVVHARLDLARMLLRSERLTVAQVAEQCGYVDLSHFRRAFKKHAGRAPREETL